MPSTSDLVKIVLFAFSPFVAAVVFVAMILGLAAVFAGCSSAQPESLARLNEYDVRLDEIEWQLFGGTSMDEIPGRIQAAEIRLHEQRGPVKIPAKLNGEIIDICVYPEALDDGGFVINVHTEEDKRHPDGECWGTVIYPGKAVEQGPIQHLYHVDGTGKVPKPIEYDPQLLRDQQLTPIDD